MYASMYMLNQNLKLYKLIEPLIIGKRFKIIY